MKPTLPLEEPDILALWERGAGRHGVALAAALGAAGNADQTAGARNVELLALRTALFGPHWPLRARCPACGGDGSFEVDLEAIRADLARLQPPPAVTTVDWRGERRTVCACTVADLEVAATAPTLADAMLCLLGRCVVPATDSFDAEAIDALGQIIEALDPAAAIAFDLACPACGHRWSAPLDVAAALWAEIERAAEYQLLEIDTLARAYGWSEAAILRLSPLRRAAYLQLVEAS